MINAEKSQSSGSKALAFWPTLIVVFLLDFATKRWAESHLLPVYTPHEVFGNVVRFTLAFNKDAAMGLSLGGYSRVGFAVVAVVVLVVLGVFYRRTPGFATGAAAALGLVAAGALGNLMDRVLFERGVVDFIDVGLGSARFYTFNVADASITCGAILLAFLSMKSAKPTEAPAITPTIAQSQE
ncbi:MAG: signal peptidase II [Gemmatimonadales bacterium]